MQLVKPLLFYKLPDSLVEEHHLLNVVAEVHIGDSQFQLQKVFLNSSD